MTLKRRCRRGSKLGMITWGDIHIAENWGPPILLLLLSTSALTPPRVLSTGVVAKETWRMVLSSRPLRHDAAHPGRTSSTARCCIAPSWWDRGPRRRGHPARKHPEHAFTWPSLAASDEVPSRNSRWGSLASAAPVAPSQSEARASFLGQLQASVKAQCHADFAPRPPQLGATTLPPSTKTTSSTFLLVSSPQHSTLFHVKILPALASTSQTLILR